MYEHERVRCIVGFYINRANTAKFLTLPSKGCVDGVPVEFNVKCHMFLPFC